MEVIKSLIDFILHIDKHLSAIISQYHALTYLILFVIIFAETGFVITPFLPGDSLLFAAGALIAAGATGLDIYLLTLSLIIAAFTGNTVNYFLGNYLGPKVFKEKNKILKLDYYLQTKAFFDRHGGKAVIISRFMPIIRTIAPFVVGVGRMPYWLGNVPFFKANFSLVGIAIILVSVIPPVIAAIKTRSGKKTA